MNSFVPVAYAAVDTTALANILNPIFANIVDPIVYTLFTVAVVVFAFGVLQLVFRGSNEEALDRGKRSMWGGAIGMFIMLSAWGIIHLISNTIGGF